MKNPASPDKAPEDWTIEEIAERNEDAGRFFFSANTMRAFGNDLNFFDAEVIGGRIFIVQVQNSTKAPKGCGGKGTMWEFNPRTGDTGVSKTREEVMRMILEEDALAADVYTAMTKAGVQIEHHETDLYVPVNEQTTAILGNYPLAESIATKFRSDHPDDKGTLWYDIPFAYLPGWPKRST